MATQYLMNRVIPDFAQKLLKSKTLNIDMILTDLHTRGINFRFFLFFPLLLSFTHHSFLPNQFQKIPRFSSKAC